MSYSEAKHNRQKSRNEHFFVKVYTDTYVEMYKEPNMSWHL